MPACAHSKILPFVCQRFTVLSYPPVPPAPPPGDCGPLAQAAMHHSCITVVIPADDPGLRQTVLFRAEGNFAACTIALSSSSQSQSQVVAVAAGVLRRRSLHHSRFHPAFVQTFMPACCVETLWVAAYTATAAVPRHSASLSPRQHAQCVTPRHALPSRNCPNAGSAVQLRTRLPSSVTPMAPCPT